MNGLTCWKCGADLKAVPLPLGRRAECPACHAELHACRMCRHFLPGKARSCMEPMAEVVKDTVRANFCDWFQPGRNQTTDKATGGDRNALDDLFGDAPKSSASDPDSARKALDDLFGG